MNKVLALIDRPIESDECAEAAARLASERNIPLILAVDPRDEPLRQFESELSHLVHIASRQHVPTATMLVRVKDADAVLRAVRCNDVDVVVLPAASRSKDIANIARALEREEIRVAPIEPRPRARA